MVGLITPRPGRYAPRAPLPTFGDHLAHELKFAGCWNSAASQDRAVNGTQTLAPRRAPPRPRATRLGVNRGVRPKTAARPIRSRAAQNSQFCALMKLAAQILPTRQIGGYRAVRRYRVWFR